MTSKRTALRLTVVDPCREDWDGMIGGDDIRLCGRCRKNVYNLSEMTEAQVRDLAQGPACVRFWACADGCVATSRCPPVRRAARRRLLALVACRLPRAAGLWGCVVGLHGLLQTPVARKTMGIVGQPVRVQPVMGAPMPQPRPI